MSRRQTLSQRLGNNLIVVVLVMGAITFGGQWIVWQLFGPLASIVLVTFIACWNAVESHTREQSRQRERAHEKRISSAPTSNHDGENG